MGVLWMGNPWFCCSLQLLGWCCRLVWVFYLGLDDWQSFVTCILSLLRILYYLMLAFQVSFWAHLPHWQLMYSIDWSSFMVRIHFSKYLCFWRVLIWLNFVAQVVFTKSALTFNSILIMSLLFPLQNYNYRPPSPHSYTCKVKHFVELKNLTCQQEASTCEAEK